MIKGNFNLTDKIMLCLATAGVVNMPVLANAGENILHPNEAHNANQFGKQMFEAYKIGGLTFNLIELLTPLGVPAYANKLLNEILPENLSYDSNNSSSTPGSLELGNGNKSQDVTKNIYNINELDINYIHDFYVHAMDKYINTKLDSKVDKTELTFLVDQYVNSLFAERISDIENSLTSLKSNQNLTNDQMNVVNRQIADLDILYNQLALEDTLLNLRVSDNSDNINLLNKTAITNALLNYAAEFNSPDQATVREAYDNFAVPTGININQNRFDINDQITAVNQARAWFQNLSPELYNTLTDQDVDKVKTNFSNTRAGLLLNDLVRNMHPIDSSVSGSSNQIDMFNGKDVAIQLTNRVLAVFDSNVLDLINIYERTDSQNIREDYQGVNSHLELARQRLDVFEQNIINSATFNSILSGYAGMQQQVSEGNYVLSNGDTLSVDTLTNHFRNNMVSLNSADEFYLQALGCAGDSLSNNEAVGKLMTQDQDFFKFVMRHYLIENSSELHKDLVNFNSVEYYQGRVNNIINSFNQYRQTIDDLTLFPEKRSRFSVNAGAGISYGNGDKKNGISNVSPDLFAYVDGTVYAPKDIADVLARVGINCTPPAVADGENSEVLPSNNILTKKFQNKNSELSAYGALVLKKMLSPNFSAEAGVGYEFTEKSNQVTGGTAYLNGEPLVDIASGEVQKTYKQGLMGFLGVEYDPCKNVVIKGQAKFGNNKPKYSASVGVRF